MEAQRDRGSQLGADLEQTWRRPGAHRFRTPAATLIDRPLELVGWVATVWPDATSAMGWQRAVWDARSDGRGWHLPGDLALGDVVEFGGDRDGRVDRWYGIVDTYEPERWLTLLGPYENPADAHRRANELLDAIRHEPTSAHRAREERPSRCCRSGRNRRSR